MKQLLKLAPCLALAMVLPAAPAFALDGHNEMASEEDSAGTESGAGPAGSPIGQFGGSYTCQDGEHGLYLELWLGESDDASAEVYGVLGFFPVLAGKDGPSGMVAGSFEISGMIVREGMTISLEPGEWIVQPEGYGAAGLEGTLVDAGNGDMRIVGKPVVPGAPEFCTDLIATGFAPLLAEEEEEEAYAEEAEEAEAEAEE